jgi:hypothetical protein
MPDERSALERVLWEKIGPPLYYCAECLRTVKVKAREGEAPLIDRPCGHTGEIIAPRKAVCVGKGGASMGTRAKIAWDQAKAAVTGRCA